ncbi:electron transfer flavoprotein subunit alpha/FixB family protein [Kosmotoga pacifica]|uniref:Electron transfer flavoprotein subunit alpha n=1 Tax=Kosmotoga pacifica TaxID=1330330 RepID=A0A0G2ZFS5_9BACT|nr:electron transfer flavoprotein subunit alpha/FixB family protein [Kosmotoga pacifica]AKI97643.1 electron transfer flavoprotein subunit alpha [Kosmotoga pacifica]
MADEKKIFVYVERRNGEANRASWELVGKARDLTEKLPNSSVWGIVLGENYEEICAEGIARGCDGMIVLKSPDLNHYISHYYKAALVEIVKEYSPEIFLIAATLEGRELAGMVATEIETGLTADCTELGILEDGSLAMTRPTFGGNLIATIYSPKHKPQMATVRPGIMKELEPDPSRKGEVIIKDFKIPVQEKLLRLLDFIPAEESVNIQYAKVIVAGGKGVGGKEGFEKLKELANVLHGEIGASRTAVKEGWISEEYQVGQTGKAVRPIIYFACGISGAIQHIVGIKESEIIVAINIDEKAPIFQIADIGIVGDLHQVVPALTKKFSELLSNKGGKSS